MPRTALTINETKRTSNGLDVDTALVAADQANGMVFTNSNQNVFIYVYNGDASGKTLTFTTSQSFDGLALPDLTVSVGAGERKMIGPFGNSQYGNSGLVYVDFDNDTSVTVGAFKLGSISSES